MATLLELRRRVRSVKNMRQITRAMKLVAGAKLRRAQDSMLAARPYSEKMWDVLGEIATTSEQEISHPLLEPREVKRITAVVITSDRGLCGAFNTNVIRYATRALNTWQEKDLHVLAAGRKGWDHFRRGDLEVDKADDDILKHLSYPRAAALAQYLIELYETKETDAVYIIYNEFVSALRQNLVVEPLLPIRELPFGEEYGVSFREAARAFAEAQVAGHEHEHQGFSAIGAVATDVGESAAEAAHFDGGAATEMVDYIYEPSGQAIIDELLPRFAEAQLFQALLESSAAEHAARMAAMDSATKNAEELIENLTLTMNKLRQEAITNEILEVVGGAAAQS
jgi:F-type H+-transporting ATPase subunit gamma